jgi:hypothetical protein
MFFINSFDYFFIGGHPLGICKLARKQLKERVNPACAPAKSLEPGGAGVELI